MMLAVGFVFGVETLHIKESRTLADLETGIFQIDSVLYNDECRYSFF